MPEELWANRDRFFYDGMQLEIGPCYRDYAPPEFFARATKRFRGQARLVARRRRSRTTRRVCRSRPTRSIRNDPQAGARWAWNWVSRYQAGGSFGDFRLSLLARDLQQRFTGSFFFVPLTGRAERAERRLPLRVAAHRALGRGRRVDATSTPATSASSGSTAPARASPTSSSGTAPRAR